MAPDTIFFRKSRNQNKLWKAPEKIRKRLSNDNSQMKKKHFPNS